MVRKLKTYPVNLDPNPEIPADVWDPAWEESAVAAQMAARAYAALRDRGQPFLPGQLLEGAALIELEPRRTEERYFEVPSPVPVPRYGVRLVGGAFGEIYRRYAFGPRPAVNFHAQEVYFGIDQEGRFFVQARVGVRAATLGTRAALRVEFLGDDGQSFGGVRWQGAVEGEQDVELLFAGREEALAQAADQLRSVRVGLETHYL